MSSKGHFQPKAFYDSMKTEVFRDTQATYLLVRIIVMMEIE